MTCNKCGKEAIAGTTCECGNIVPEKKKSKIKILVLLSPLIIFAVLAALLSFGSDTSNDANLGFTIAEFVERYNETVDSHLKDDSDPETYEKVQNMLKLDVDYFFQSEEDGDFYVASNNNVLNYIVLMDDSGEKVQAISFKFFADVTETQMEQFLIFCKWFAEAVKPGMNEDYYTDTLVNTIENGETREEGIAYFWREEDGYCSYEIYYAA